MSQSSPTTVELSETKMPEAEVCIRLAFGLLAEGLVADDLDLAIDGAQVKTGDTVHFPITEFLHSAGWDQENPSDDWRGVYAKPDVPFALNIRSDAGRGDLVATLTTGRRLRAECKKGTFERSKSSSEYKLLREALGQVLTVSEVGDSDLLAVAVPSSPKFEALASQWRDAPLVKRAQIQILTIDRNDRVHGLRT